MLKITVLKLQSLTWALMLALALLFGAPTLAAADAAPTVLSVSVPSDGTYGTGQNLDFTVQRTYDIHTADLRHGFNCILQVFCVFL